MKLYEGGDEAKGLGGNVFKDAEGNPLTQRINQIDVPTTTKFLEQITGLDLMNNMVGSTGQKPTSGDLDYAIDATVISKDALKGVIFQYCKSKGVPENEIENKGRTYRGGYIAQTGIEVHFRTPINGDPKNGYVQSDFNFVDKMAWTKFMLAAMPAGSEYKGVDRAVLFNSIGKVLGVKVTVNSGVHDRMSNELVTDDPAEMAKAFVPNGTVKDLAGVENILGALRNDSQRDAKLKDFADYLTKSGRQMPQLESSVHPTEWFKHLSSKLK
jgi:hypothetical protein